MQVSMRLHMQPDIWADYDRLAASRPAGPADVALRYVEAGSDGVD